jgi:HAD superfamily hydrolase (TIGR01509 family)
MSRTMLRAVLFDMDGTLADSERENMEATARALLRGQGISLTSDEREFVVGRSWVDIHRRLFEHYPDLSWSMDQLIAATVAERERMLPETTLSSLPGAHAAVARFAHLPRAVVTGSSRAEAVLNLRALGLIDAFQAIFAAEDVPTSKPAPDGYLLAAAALGVDPRDCLVVEDSYAGIHAGRAAGARVVAVRAGNFLGQDQSAAHRIVDTLDELTEALAVSLWPSGMVPE